MDDPANEKSLAKKEIRELRTTIGESLKAGNRAEVRKLRKQVKRLKRRTRELAAMKAEAKPAGETPAATEPSSQ